MVLLDIKAKELRLIQLNLASIRYQSLK